MNGMIPANLGKLNFKVATHLQKGNKYSLCKEADPLIVSHGAEHETEAGDEEKERDDAEEVVEAHVKHCSRFEKSFQSACQDDEVEKDAHNQHEHRVDTDEGAVVDHEAHSVDSHPVLQIFLTLKDQIYC